MRYNYKKVNEFNVSWLNSWIEPDSHYEYALKYESHKVKLVIRNTVSGTMSVISPAMTNRQMYDTLVAIHNYITIAPGY